MAQIGDVVAGRFVLMAQAGHGGMGAVFKAHDRLCDTTVAIKLMYDPGEVEIQRFLREATVLESFNHEHIVAHRSHGVSEWGDPWLAMEWLEGEDLATRLHRGRLSVEDSLQVIRGAALALDAAHSRGIVHRDIKPSNLYLVEGKPEAVKIVDFGIAAATMGTSRLTATSIILGTPGYMAPEQARGDAGVGPPADIFSLGCVLYECLAGKPAFVGAHLIALLAKVLLADPPKLSDERPNVPQFVLRLCEQMMAKSPDERFPNGRALVDILNRLTTSPNTSVEATRQPAGTTQMGVYERQLVSSIVIAPQQNNPALQSSAPSTVPDETLKSIRQIVETPGTSLHVLADGSSVVVFTLPSNPVDQAANAALCAFRLRDIVEGRPIVLVTGHRDSTLRSPVGEIMDRAGDLLSRIPLGETRVGVDDDTRALLESRFDIGSANGVYFLQSLGAVDESRFLLGKATPFVGRERELTRLLEIVEEGFDERRAQAILVIGAAGMGKSRLRQEFLRRLQQRHSGLVLEVGRADILGNSGAFSLIAGMFRQALGIHLGDPIAKQQDKIAHIINLVLKSDDAQRVTEFICELIGAPFPDERSLRLRAARQDAQIMASQIEAAYVDLMRASVQNYPIVLVLEDLHWADAASFKLLDAALRELADEPLIIMAFARPEVKTRFPRLWQSRQLYEIVLNPLSRKSAIELARNVLGDDFDAKRIGAIVDHAAGNAFFLEELLRAAALGGDDKLPPTVLGMVEARIGLLDALARRVLRAASIFGSSFWVNGVKTLLGEGADMLDDILQELLEQEFIQPAKTQRF
ncbi:MAG TPA: protein kinase, partial [Polyangium sp.]|nr:protein kinase [Polyangium sp.]